MAKEDFKNKVTKAQEDLFKSLDNERTKRHTVVTKIISEISKVTNTLKIVGILLIDIPQPPSGLFTTIIGFVILNK